MVDTRTTLTHANVIRRIFQNNFLSVYQIQTQLTNADNFHRISRKQQMKNRIFLMKKHDSQKWRKIFSYHLST